MFENREAAARLLAKRLQGLQLVDPLVLAIPRGGVVTGAVLADELGAELDVVLSRKLRAPHQPELAMGAVSEQGQVHLCAYARQLEGFTDTYLEKERQHQLNEIERRKKVFRAARPAARVTGRSVILTDDGIATGSTMLAALQVVLEQQPKEVLLAVPVAPPDRLDEFYGHCEQVVCLLTPTDFMSVGQFYMDFDPVDDEEVARLLKQRYLALQGAAQ